LIKLIAKCDLATTPTLLQFPFLGGRGLLKKNLIKYQTISDHYEDFAFIKILFIMDVVENNVTQEK
jgi:hypothetical protein